MNDQTITAAVSAVVNRLGDLGLRPLAEEMSRAFRFYQMREVCGRAIMAARAIHTAAEHFGQRPIADFASELEQAGLRLGALLDARHAAQYEARGEREPGAWSFDEWMANGGHAPPRTGTGR